MYRGRRIDTNDIGIRSDTNEWIEGDLIHFNGRCFIATDIIITDKIFDGQTRSYGFGGFYEVNRHTVGQDTGIVDTNGKKIYSGSTVVAGLLVPGQLVRGACVFKDGAFGLEWYHGSIKKFTPFTSMSNIELMVVGNTYDDSL